MPKVKANDIDIYYDIHVSVELLIRINGTTVWLAISAAR
jgi:hypothetical protein